MKESIKSKISTISQNKNFVEKFHNSADKREGGILICISLPADNRQNKLKNLFSIIFQEIEACSLSNENLIEDLKFLVFDYLDNNYEEELMPYCEDMNPDDFDDFENCPY